jgi:hypothetical protein
MVGIFSNIAFRLSDLNIEICEKAFSSNGIFSPNLSFIIDSTNYFINQIPKVFEVHQSQFKWLLYTFTRLIQNNTPFRLTIQKEFVFFSK